MSILSLNLREILQSAEQEFHRVDCFVFFCLEMRNEPTVFVMSQQEQVPSWTAVSSLQLQWISWVVTPFQRVDEVIG